jgi:hypothetical protein
MRKGQTLESKKPALNAGFLLFGALDRIRTCDRSVRSRVLYPAELRVQLAFDKPDHRWLKQVACITANNPLNGALDRIRTCDRSVRSRVLYPAELRVHLLPRIIGRSIILSRTFASKIKHLPLKPDYNALHK